MPEWAPFAALIVGVLAALVWAVCRAFREDDMMDEKDRLLVPDAVPGENYLRQSTQAARQMEGKFREAADDPRTIAVIGDEVQMVADPAVAFGLRLEAAIKRRDAADAAFNAAHATFRAAERELAGEIARQIRLQATLSAIPWALDMHLPMEQPRLVSAGAPERVAELLGLLRRCNMLVVELKDEQCRLSLPILEENVYLTFPDLGALARFVRRWPQLTIDTAAIEKRYRAAAVQQLEECDRLLRAVRGEAEPETPVEQEPVE